MYVARLAAVVAVLASGFAGLAEGAVRVRESAGKAVIDNARVRVEYDLARGTCDAFDAESGRTGLAGAQTRIGEWASAGEGVKRSWRDRPVSDDLGKGRALRIRCERTGAPAILLEITLYEGRGCIVLTGGVDNTTSKDLRIKEIHPLTGGAVFPGLEIQDPRTLNGISGAGKTEVLEGAQRSSPNNLLLTFTADGRRYSLVLGGLTYHEFGKWVGVGEGGGQTAMDLRAADPVGKLVEPGRTYLGDERFYVNFTTPDPFEALERYGLAVRAAQHARPNIYSFPTLCAWYVQDFSGGPKINHTTGLVEEMDAVARTGFLRYAPVALRLVPDKYHDDTEQGWWDNEHWRKFGHYTKPYETSGKWCRALLERGGLPFSYFQTGMPSDDYARAFPGHMLNNDISKLPLQHPHHQPHVTFDYTDPDFQKHMREVWGKLGKAGLKGVMFDYPETGWRPEGGFEDRHATTASAYRTVFALCREGLGPDAFIHERNLGETGRPLLDVSAGLVDSQRVWGDSNQFTPEMVRRCALRWYKTRVLYSYDMDSKTLFEGRAGDRPPLPATRRQALLTMLYVTAGRVLLSDSFRQLTPEMLHDLSRIFPIYTTARSARPVDAFTDAGAACPRIYDFPVDNDWHQVMLFNPDFAGTVRIGVRLAGEAADGALGLDPAGEYWAYDFWADRLVAKLDGRQSLEMDLQPGEAKMLSVRRVLDRPQVLSTNRHVMQGYVDLKDVAWKAGEGKLAGTASVVQGETYKIVVALNGRRVATAGAAARGVKVAVRPTDEGLAEIAIDSNSTSWVDWWATFAPRPVKVRVNGT
ncbi:MAG: hypothetical protein WBD75_03755 [Phycisphaerae bacterium]